MAPQVAYSIREATLADVPAMAGVTAAGFIEDDVFGNFMHPRRKEFPDDWRHSWQKEIQTILVKADSRNYVCFENDSGRVAAICLVKRLGDGASELVNPATAQLPQASALPLKPWEEKNWTDRSADPEAQGKFEKNWDDIAHHFTGDRKECWLIDFFCVHPDFQRKGLGRSLLQKAVDLGENENPKVPVAVISSAAGDQFYATFGFEQVGQASVGDLAHVEGGSIKFYERHLK